MIINKQRRNQIYNHNYDNYNWNIIIKFFGEYNNRYNKSHRNYNLDQEIEEDLYNY